MFAGLLHVRLGMLLQGYPFDGFPAELAALFLVFLVIALIVSVVIVILVAVWMHRDAKQRGESAGVWVTLFIVASLFGLVPFGILVVIIYLLTRPKELKYDRYGNPLVPGTPPPGWQPAPPGWSSPTPSTPMIPPPTGWQAAPPSPGGWPGPPTAPPPSAPLWGAARTSKVKCPRCHTIFEYQKMPSGPSHVKCPSCGEEGAI